MKTPEEMRVTLRERILGAIGKETEGLLDFDQIVWEKTDQFIELILERLFGDDENDDEEGLEELCLDMDRFAEE